MRLMLCGMVLVLAGRGDAAAPPTLREPLQGMFFSGVVMATSSEGGNPTFPSVYFTEAGGAGRVREVQYALITIKSPARWRVAHGGFWSDGGLSPYQDPHNFQTQEWTDRKDLGELIRGRLLDHPDARDKDISRDSQPGARAAASAP